MTTERKLLILLGAAIALILTVGILTPVYLGDEVVHFRIAEYFLKSGRPVFEPYFLHVPKIGYKLAGPIVWSWGLSVIWAVAHIPAAWLAQVYQVGFLILLLYAIFKLDKELGGESSPFGGVWFALSCPMVTAFSILLYLDVAASALIVLVFWMLLRKKYFLGGAVYAVLIMTKETGFFMGPGIILAVLVTSEDSFWKKIRSLVCFFTTALILLTPDIIFRLKNYGYAYYAPPHPEYVNKEITYWYTPASINHDLIGSLFYLGGSIPVGLLIYLLGKQYTKKQSVTFGAALLYGGLCAYFFPRTLDIRYFMPAVCLLAPLAARGFSQVKKTAVRGVFYLLMAAQIVGTCAAVYQKRRIPPGIEQGFEYVRKNVPEKAVILYPAENIINHTGRPMVWVRAGSFYNLFWNASLSEVKRTMEEAYIAYIAVPAERVYDDTTVRHSGGYPKSFVKRLESGEFPFLEKVYSNFQISIWRFKGDHES